MHRLRQHSSNVVLERARAQVIVVKRVPYNGRYVAD